MFKSVSLSFSDSFMSQHMPVFKGWSTEGLVGDASTQVPLSQLGMKPPKSCEQFVYFIISLELCTVYVVKHTSTAIRYVSDLPVPGHLFLTLKPVCWEFSFIAVTLLISLCDKASTQALEHLQVEGKQSIEGMVSRTNSTCVKG